MQKTAPAAIDRTPPTLAAGVTKTAPTWRAAYSDRTAALMAALSQLAYVPFESVPSPGPSQPKPEVPGGREALARYLGPDFTDLQVFNRDDTQAYLAVSADFAVLAFRGTANFQDWITNLDAILVPLEDAPADVHVHKGFLSAFNCCKAEIKAAVEAKVGSKLGLYITGHSLGGALAQIASAVLERDNLAACYTFGSPRVGTVDFDVQVKCPHYRLTNDWDIVPGVPPPSLRGYQHSGDPRLIQSGPKLYRRDRSVITRFFVDLAAIVVGVFSRRFLAIDDHMIWNYRSGLDRVAAARSEPPTPRTAGALAAFVSPRSSRAEVIAEDRGGIAPAALAVAALGAVTALGLMTRSRRGPPLRFTRP